jgi:hypothetical protein
LVIPCPADAIITMSLPIGAANLMRSVLDFYAA